MSWGGQAEGSCREEGMGGARPQGRPCGCGRRMPCRRPSAPVHEPPAASWPRRRCTRRLPHALVCAVPAPRRQVEWDRSDCWIAHCCMLDEGERRLFAERGLGVAHCPSSNCRLASGGWAPAAAALQQPLQGCCMGHAPLLLHARTAHSPSALPSLPLLWPRHCSHPAAAGRRRECGAGHRQARTAAAAAEAAALRQQPGAGCSPETLSTAWPRQCLP